MSRKIKKKVQGTYIKEDFREALVREASRQGIFPATLASEILEKGIESIIEKEKKNESLQGKNQAD